MTPKPRRLTATELRLVKLRANYRCEYCQVPEEHTEFNFHADHVIAFKHHKDDSVKNRAWACFACNTHKGSDLSTFDPKTRHLTRLYDPRAGKWNDHFKIDAGKIIGLNRKARGTVELLKMNRPDRVAHRLMLIGAGLW